MEKISGIIPGSPRLTSVDMRDAAPVRPGTPSFGRPQGVSTLKEAQLAAAAAVPRSANARGENAGWKAKDLEHAAMAAEVSNSFFVKAHPTIDALPATGEMRSMEHQPVTRDFSESEVESSPAGFKTDELGSLRAAIRPSAELSYESDEADETTLKQPDGLFPKGSFIDRTA